MTAPRRVAQPPSRGGSEGSQTLIHRSNCSNPHGSSLSGRFAPFGCDRCETGCDGRADCRLKEPGWPVQRYSALSPDGRRVLLEVGQYFDRDGVLRDRRKAGGADAKSTP